MINKQFGICKVCGNDKKYSLTYRNIDGDMIHVNGCAHFCDSEFKPKINMNGSNPVYKFEKEIRK